MEGRPNGAAGKTEQDRIDINDLINLHGHLTDAGELDQAGELFTRDVTYDLDDFGLGSLHGTAAMREAALAMGEANPVGHHVTNIVITRIDDRSARVQSKGIGIKADGTAGSVAYDDIVTRQPDGWKISYRKVTARRAALGGQAAGAREVLERLRQAAISQSADDMSRVYAADAVHEFPFTRPGLPSRLERPGRNRELDSRRVEGLPAEVRAVPHARHLRHQRPGNDHRRAGSPRRPAHPPASSRCPTSSCSPCATGRSPACATTSASPPPRPPWASTRPSPVMPAAARVRPPGSGPLNATLHNVHYRRFLGVAGRGSEWRVPPVRRRDALRSLWCRRRQPAPCH